MRAAKRERWVRFVSVNLGVSPISSLVSEISLKKIVDEVIDAISKKLPLQRTPRTTARQHARLVDLVLSDDEKYAVLLFRLIDKDAIDVAYEDFEDGDIEPHPKTPTQGNRSTAHLVIRLKPKLEGKKKKYPALLEETTGLGASRIEPILNSLARKFGRGSYKDRSGREERYHCSIEVKPKVVGTIRDELTNGVLKGFTLVHSFPPKQGNDETIYLEDKKRRLEVAVVGAAVGDKIDAIWDSVRKKANNQEYELVKASYENTDGRLVSVDMQTRRSDALEDLVTKTKKIELEADANYDQSGVSPSIMKKMIDALQSS
ncbi:hypothetical protein [Oleiagrimonas soli]|uniref:Uncharacterized protein n=1 Tax=Oleiagrimonas soli TaxID=1543381 RepID=A0A841KHT0_9GAMM|nr:hypothetical protein [Oleiagrimonas soli]MBB6183537.1 hypothetical protein [Oleiagrimonas soli]